MLSCHAEPSRDFRLYIFLYRVEYFKNPCANCAKMHDATIFHAFGACTNLCKFAGFWCKIGPAHHTIHGHTFNVLWNI